jgi:hypothetical protein
MGHGGGGISHVNNVVARTEFGTRSRSSSGYDVQICGYSYHYLYFIY